MLLSVFQQGLLDKKTRSWLIKRHQRNFHLLSDILIWTTPKDEFCGHLKLEGGFKVSLTKTCKSSWGIEVRTKERIMVLGCKSEVEQQDWFRALQSVRLALVSPTANRSPCDEVESLLMTDV